MGLLVDSEQHFLKENYLTAAIASVCNIHMINLKIYSNIYGPPRIWLPAWTETSTTFMAK